ncbi:helix-turn-helix domain-containing protein [Deinococcus sp. HSC-46F16]|uniref:helix-turn-helix domain-containing protein n=1 Tax=Deinococcus sp. HSC-46F16 TaxID=2910968 RepID=UPI003531D476
MDERYISVAEFAEKFNVSTTLVYRLIKDGVINAVRIGDRNYRISPEAVRTIVERRLIG